MFAYFQPSSRIHRKRKPKRGVLLLVVLSLLVLFVLSGLTFVLVTGMYSRGASQLSRFERSETAPEKLLDEALYQLLRDTTNPGSSLYSHSVLKDYYGNDGIVSKIKANPAPVANGQLWRIELEGPYASGLKTSHHYSGTPVTFISGDAAGHTSRIVAHEFLLIAGREYVHLYIESLASDSAIGGIIPAPGDQLVLSGVPLNGTGFGYNPATQQLDLKLAGQTFGFNVSLFPHFGRYLPQFLATTPPDVGGGDESYDAPDFQNMHLAWVPTTPPGAADRVAAKSGGIYPSFHRPDLCEFFEATAVNPSTPPSFTKAFFDRVVMRPTWKSHPNSRFSGSNPAMALSTDAILAKALVEGPWDVDNDGDGRADSIWLDLDFPAQTASDGRQYKPLFAILCVDLDGRLNVNVHGSAMQDATNYYTNVYASRTAAGFPNTTPFPGLRGNGYGPAEVNLAPLLGNVLATAIKTDKTVGRYGLDGRPGGSGDDLLSATRNTGVPFNYLNPNEYGGYGSSPDLLGQGATFLDHTGQPLTAFMPPPTPDPPNPQLSDNVDEPYELNPYGGSGVDRLYSAAELERILRASDADARSLPDRLARILEPLLTSDPTVRNLVTTHSFGSPHPHRIGTPELRQQIANRLGTDPFLSSASLVDFLRARLLAGSVPPSQLPTQVALMLPPEVVHGQRLDLNRLLGSGGDENGNGVVDEAEEAPSDQYFKDFPVGGARYNGDLTNGDERISDPRLARQILARHLYCLMMLLIDDDFLEKYPTSETGLSTTQRRQLAARRIAQWAINVVDFRDPDAVMTPFEYDSNPFNGWDVDGNLTVNNLANETAERGVVWGMEYPELLLTESLAFHDRRVKDTDKAGAGDDKRTDGSMELDTDLDQYRIPQGSLFLELYCTRNRHTKRPYRTPKAPLELYRMIDDDANPATPSVPVLDLGRMAGNLPVWRMAISEIHQGANIDRSAYVRAQTKPDTTMFDPLNMSLFDPPEPLVGLDDRIIWLAGKPAAGVPDENKIFYLETGVNQLPGGQYLVIGPRSITELGWNQSTNQPSAQRIELTLTTGLEHFATTGAPVTPTGPIQRPLSAIVSTDPPAIPTNDWINDARRIGVNISEPLPSSPNYYKEPNPTNDGRIPFDAYDNPTTPTGTFLPSPLDGEPGKGTPLEGFTATQTIANFRTVFLQRLANPLEPYHPVLNPYITVDWLPVDLTVFNGEDKEPAGWDPNTPPGIGAFDKGYDDAPDPDNVRFGTRERTPANSPGNASNLWAATSPALPQDEVSIDPGAGFNFPFNLRHTLGYLNASFGVPQSPNSLPDYQGDPAEPFPWLTWHNRPFANALELLMVPASSPARLTQEFSVRLPNVDPYVTTDVANFRAPYGHLMNFFQSQSSDPTKPPAHFYRLLDYVEVPSRFANSDTLYNPADFASVSPSLRFKPPFNRMSKFREAGRVNLNTVSDPRVWWGIQGLVTDFGKTPNWADVEASRQGWEAGKVYPTRFANPFRAASSADLMPPPVVSAGFPNMGDMRKSGSEATIMRPHPTNSGRPLLEYRSNDAYDNSDRNPYFQYQTLQRLGSIVSTHSNVYAIWITVGYFQVDVVTDTSVTPPAVRYVLQEELNSDTGDIHRHRMFCIFDRSIPVAFEPGKNHNVDRAILVKRMIE